MAIQFTYAEIIHAVGKDLYREINEEPKKSLPMPYNVADYEFSRIMRKMYGDAEYEKKMYGEVISFPSGLPQHKSLD